MKEIASIGRAFDIYVDFSRKGTHSYAVLRYSNIAALPRHDGEKTEVQDRDVRGMCRRLEVDAEAFLAALRRG